jgi:hypothetical protein
MAAKKNTQDKGQPPVQPVQPVPPVPPIPPVPPVPPAPPEPKKQPALKVTCKKESFLRAGRQWTKEPKTVLITDLTQGQVKVLKAEPMLIVEEVEIEG